VVHVHALLFMGSGWDYDPTGLARAGGARAWHIRLGQISLVWVIGLMVLGPLVTIGAVQAHRVPFFFQPQHLLPGRSSDLARVFHPVRRRPGPAQAMGLAFPTADRRLCHADGAWGRRLLPLPFLIPYAFEIAAVLPLVFIVVCALRDLGCRVCRTPPGSGPSSLCPSY